METASLYIKKIVITMVKMMSGKAQGLKERGKDIIKV
jgi:hypothetical protein